VTEGKTRPFTDREVQTAKVGRTQVRGTTGLYVVVHPNKKNRRFIWLRVARDETAE
jgi:hypothetical protein